eukprot:COSAG06_NODE_39673_length_410_cov_0.533762_1_plen_83_part_01
MPMMSVRAFVRRTRFDTPILRFSPSVHDTAPHHLQESNGGDEEEKESTRPSRGPVNGASERRTDQDELRAGQSCGDQDRNDEQ